MFYRSCTILPLTEVCDLDLHVDLFQKQIIFNKQALSSIVFLLSILKLEISWPCGCNDSTIKTWLHVAFCKHGYFQEKNTQSQNTHKKKQSNKLEFRSDLLITDMERNYVTGVYIEEFIKLCKHVCSRDQHFSWELMVCQLLITLMLQTSCSYMEMMYMFF